ncbi:aldehyde dehydrogenase 1A1-like isoform X1 [Schistocerca gregaria]|uniref:aldehyde dehydrogenase 1A1-like isoform X1 n=1 Tax=Schistocerca gregaria TaxID=7010 RepID=UPI00211F17E7|nr:aldehyde dehydrogenase 1A1-like isoform X1 [Schistocerca gregaria]
MATKVDIKYTQLFINNEFVNSVSGKTFPVYNPANEEKIADVYEGDKADVDKAVAAAKEAFKRGSEWRTMDASKRAVLMHKLADLMMRDIQYLTVLRVMEGGKVSSASYSEVVYAADTLRYAAGWADKIHGQTIPTDGPYFTYTRKEPVGVVGQIIPWNAPVLMAAWKLAPAFATGCTVVLKPAEDTPLCALYIAALCKEAGFPAGVVNVVPGYGPTAGAAIASHPDIAKVAFTGSVACGGLKNKSTKDVKKVQDTHKSKVKNTVSIIHQNIGGLKNKIDELLLCLEDIETKNVIDILCLSEHHIVTDMQKVGKSIMAAAAQSNLKKVSLELGGKSPLIILPDADIDEAVNIAHDCVFVNQGQACCAGTRTFVHENIYDEFVKKAKAKAEARKVGDPFEDGVVQGPQINQKMMNKVLDYIKSGKEQGAHIECGGERLGTTGYFIKPTVFSNVTDDMKIAKEEIFGPVQSILKFKTLEEAIERANNTSYGLAAGILTKDINSALTCANALEAGSIWVNCFLVIPVQAPFGGYKESGIGREMGEETLHEYLEVKTVSVKLPSKS